MVSPETEPSFAVSGHDLTNGGFKPCQKPWLVKLALAKTIGRQPSNHIIYHGQTYSSTGYAKGPKLLKRCFSGKLQTRHLWSWCNALPSKFQLDGVQVSMVLLASNVLHIRTSNYTSHKIQYKGQWTFALTIPENPENGLTCLTNPPASGYAPLATSRQNCFNAPTASAMTLAWTKICEWTTASEQPGRFTKLTAWNSLKNIAIAKQNASLKNTFSL